MDKNKQRKKKQKKTLFYRTVYPLVKLANGKRTVTYEEDVPKGEGVVFVSNHAMARGPISMITNFGRPIRPWIAGEIMYKETAPDFVFFQFFSGNIKKHKRWNMFKSKFVAKILVNVFSNVGGIPVWTDRRILSTFSQTIEVLKNGEDVVIFGEKPERFTPYVAQISDGFSQFAYTYYKKTGKKIKFYPMYVGPKQISVGKHIEFDPEVPVKEERRIIAEYLRDGIYDLALKQPPHEPLSSYTEDYFKAVEQLNNEKHNQ